jgi:hypothetical protein
MSIFAPDTRGSMYALKKSGLTVEGISTLREGYYQISTRHGWKPVRIWRGQSVDPVTRETLDRSEEWQATIDHKDVDPYEIWPSVCARPISRAVYFDLVTLTPVENEFPVSMSNDEA